MRTAEAREYFPTRMGKSAFFALARQGMHWLLVRHTRRLSWRVAMQELPESLADSSPAYSASELDRLLGNSGPWIRNCGRLSSCASSKAYQLGNAANALVAR